MLSTSILTPRRMASPRSLRRQSVPARPLHRVVCGCVWACAETGGVLCMEWGNNFPTGSVSSSGSRAVLERPAIHRPQVLTTFSGRNSFLACGYRRRLDVLLSSRRVSALCCTSQRFSALVKRQEKPCCRRTCRAIPLMQCTPSPATAGPRNRLGKADEGVWQHR